MKKRHLVGLEGVPISSNEGSKSRLLMSLIVGFCRREAAALSIQEPGTIGFCINKQQIDDILEEKLVLSSYVPTIIIVEREESSES